MSLGLALDIDETLSFTLGTWISEMQRLFGNPENLTAKDLIKKYRYPENVPYWQTPEALEWKENARNSNDLQITFKTMPGSVKGASQLHKIIPITTYITVRPGTIYYGTEKWLKRNRYPVAQIIHRPNNLTHEEGNKWKAQVLVELYPKVLGIVDDNAGLLKFLPNDYKGHVFLYTHKDVPPNSPPNVYACPDWESVVKKAKETFG